MTDKKDDALKLALEALEDTLSGDLTPYQAAKTITVIREALADHIRDATKMIEQPAPVPKAHEQQEPVAWLYRHEETGRTTIIYAHEHEEGWKPKSSQIKLVGPLGLITQEKT